MEFHTIKRQMPIPASKVINCYYDSETSGLDASNDKYILGIMWVRYPCGKVEEYKHTSPDKIKSICHKISRDNEAVKVLLFSHNGFGYDFLHLFTAEELKNSQKINRNGRILQITEKVLDDNDKTESWVVFSDSLLILVASLEKIGLSLGENKDITPEEMMKGTYFDVWPKSDNVEDYPEEHWEYCRQDVKIMEAGLNKFNKLYNEWNKHPTKDIRYATPITIGSSSNRTFGFNHWPEDWQYERMVKDSAKKQSYCMSVPEAFEIKDVKISVKLYDRSKRSYFNQEYQFDTLTVSPYVFPSGLVARAKGEIAGYKWNKNWRMASKISGFGETAFKERGKIIVDKDGNIKLSIGFKGSGQGGIGTGTMIVTEDFKVDTETVYEASCLAIHNDTAQKCYYGGTVYGNPEHSGKEVLNVRSFDRNNHFPAEMKNQLFPDMNSGLNRMTPSIKQWQLAKDSDYGYWGHFELIAPEVSNGNIVLWPQRGDGKVLSYLSEGIVTGWFASPMINYAINECGWTVTKVLDLTVAKVMKPYFKDFVEKFSALRLEAQKNGDEAAALMLKLLQNNLYGKFGTRDMCERIESDGEMSDIIKGDMSDEAEWRENYNVNYYVSGKEASLYLEEKTPSEKSTVTWFGFAAFITSYSNTELCRAISKCGDSFLYCDTDSVHTQGDFIPDLDFSLKVGDWKAEQDTMIPKAIYWESKVYTWLNLDGSLYSKPKHKGTPNSDGDLTHPQPRRRIAKMRTSLKKEIELGSVLEDSSHSKKWCECWPCNRKRYLQMRKGMTINEK